MVTIPGFSGFEVIGRGGFATVYRAQQSSPTRTVAVKVLSLDLSDERAERRFRRECDATALLTGHPNVITVLESGRTVEGFPYLVLPYCPNGSLQDRINTTGPIGAEEVLQIARKLTAALMDVHRAGILHRDIKPHNVLVTSFGEPALADFGIATLLDSGVRTSTTASLTPLYTAPEIIRGGTLTEAADVYSLGATLYALIAGRPPFRQFEEEGVYQLFERIVNDAPPTLGQSLCPPALDALIGSMLAKAPGQRPALGEIAAQLDAIAASPPTHSPASGASAAGGATTWLPPGPGEVTPSMSGAGTVGAVSAPMWWESSGPPAAGATTGTGDWGHTTGTQVGRSSRGWVPALVGVGVAVAVLAAGTVWWMTSDSQETPSETADDAIRAVDFATEPITLQQPERCGGAEPKLRDPAYGDLDGDGREEAVVVLRCEGDPQGPSDEVQVFSIDGDEVTERGTVAVLAEPADRLETYTVADGHLVIDALQDPSSTPSGDFTRPVRHDVTWNGDAFAMQTIARVELVGQVLPFDQNGFRDVVGFDAPIGDVQARLTEVFDAAPSGSSAPCPEAASYTWSDPESGWELTVEGTAEQVTAMTLNGPVIHGWVLRSGTLTDVDESGASVGSTADELRGAWGGDVDGPYLDADNDETVILLGGGQELVAVTSPDGGENPGIRGFRYISPEAACD